MVEFKPRLSRNAWNTRVGSRLRRIARGLTFREIAERTRMNPETVRRYMRFGDPCILFLLRFCQEFDVSADAILGLKPSPDGESGCEETGAGDRAPRARASKPARRSARTAVPRNSSTADDGPSQRPAT